MDEMIYKKDAINAIMGEFPDAHYPNWFANIIEKLPPKNLINESDYKVTVDKAIKLLIYEKSCVDTTNCDHECKICVYAGDQEEISQALKMAIDVLFRCIT